ncbi:MAG: hypothetical protein QNJ72_42485 [Pleurocapsa sp. MO_226.B13]|nr:hypothetical protein [Pleurocapsa sp. MO_226.B13]
MNRVRGDTIASGDLLQSIINKGRKIVVATPDSEEARFLDYFGANASVNTGDINQMIVRPDVLKIEILEEFLHGTQQKLGIIEKLGNFGSEIHVKNFMIRHKKMLGLSSKDIQALKIMRNSYIEGGQL